MLNVSRRTVQSAQKVVEGGIVESLQHESMRVVGARSLLSRRASRMATASLRAPAAAGLGEPPSAHGAETVTAGPYLLGRAERLATAARALNTVDAGHQTLSPQLATLVDAPPEDGSGWLHEAKFDRDRLLSRIESGTARHAASRATATDWSAKLPQLAAAFAALPVESAWIDGEIVVGRR